MSEIIKIAYVGNDPEVMQSLEEEIVKLDHVELVEDPNDADEIVYGFNVLRAHPEPPQIKSVEKIRSYGPSGSKRSRKNRWA